MPYPLDRFRGIFPAALTMFDQENNLDEEATARHWDWLISNQQAGGLVISGTSGEFIALDIEERLRLFRLAKDVVRGRVPVIFGSGHYSTKLSIRLSQEAQECGADALIIILPYYQRPPKTAVIEHYRRIRNSVDLPLMLYNNPLNSACVELSPIDIARLVEEDVLHMVKSTFGNVEPIHDLYHIVGDRMAIFYGSFIAAFEGLCAGAHGWISGILNVATRAANLMFKEVVAENDARKGYLIWRRLLPLVHLVTYQQLGSTSDLAIYRAILKLWGLHGGYCRDPFFPLDVKQEEELRRLLTASGWIDPDQVLAEVESYAGV
jgi:4-hydroxy-tetrahydrodipicolinate synthase